MQWAQSNPEQVQAHIVATATPGRRTGEQHKQTKRFLEEIVRVASAKRLRDIKLLSQRQFIAHYVSQRP
eukprot:891127-Alexandrium_andersonii.AAC.1